MLERRATATSTPTIMQERNHQLARLLLTTSCQAEKKSDIIGKVYQKKKACTNRVLIQCISDNGYSVEAFPFSLGTDLVTMKQTYYVGAKF